MSREGSHPKPSAWWALCSTAVWALVAPDPLPSQSARVVRETTTVRAYDGRTMAGEFLSIAVPERRGSPSRSITFAALRLASTVRRPGTPIVFLMGGPGIPGTVMARVPPYFTLFQRLRELADVIVVDQRGLGRSAPVLDCPFGATLPDSLFLVPGQLVAAFQVQVAACAERWRAQGIDDAATAPFGAPVDNEFLTDGFCRAVGFDTSPIEFPQPVRSSRPALLLTGTLDATNPSENARAVALGLTRATLLDVHNAPHEALTVPAVQDAIVAFLKGQAVASLRLEAAPPRFPTLPATLSSAQPSR